VPQERRACFPHYLPNFPIPRASSQLKPSFLQPPDPRYKSRVTGNLAPNMPFFALPDLLVTAHGEPRGLLLLPCLCFGESSFCAADCITVPRSYLGVCWMFWYRSCFLGASVALWALMLHLKPRQSLRCCAVVLLGSADPERVHRSGRWEHSRVLLCQQSARPCRRDGFCNISRPPIQIQALLAPVKLSDNL